MSLGQNFVEIFEKYTMMNIERFLAKIKVSDSGCWDWTACMRAGGYGGMTVNGKLCLAHRVSYELWYGKIPEGLVIDHLCRNKKCVNPTHLEAVTQKENVRRGDSGINQRVKTHCSQGHPYSGTNLYITKNGFRECKICRSVANIKYKRRKKSYRNLPLKRKDLII